MSALRVRQRTVLLALIAAAAAPGCSEFARQGRSPSQLVIVRLETPAVEFVQLQGGTGVPGSIQQISGFGVGPLFSDVNPPNSDRGRVVLRQILRDPGAPGAPSVPTPLNDITVTEFEVRYRLPNGRSTPGVDVPHPVRGGLTITLSGEGTTTAEFELVRRVAKQEPPLAALRDNSSVVVSTIADVTFFGRDQAGNSVSATGSVHVNFADF